jgi:Zinc carboxypeptidase
MRNRAIAAAIAALGGATAAFAQDDLDRYERFVQPPAVSARYGDVPVGLDAPALSSGRATFTDQQELEAFLASATRRGRQLVLGSLGQTQQGRDIPYVIATAEGLANPAEIRALGRPIVWLIGLQHGNEPAGGESMLAVVSALAGGELAALLDRVTVVVVPRANPDGAAAFRRDTANGLDANRDHLLMLLPETRALRAAMNALPPDVVLDAHEFTVANRWLSKFGVIQAVDALLLEATHPNLRGEVSALARNRFRPGIEAALRAHGLASHDYYTTTLEAADKVVSMGGNAPGTARNAFGLHNAVSFLIESRGVGLGREGFQRRVATHYLAAKAVLETAAVHAGELRATTAAARRATATDIRPLVIAHRLATRPTTLPFLDPVTGEPRPTAVTFRDSRAATATVARARPAGYLVSGLHEEARATLRRNGIAMCRLAEAAEVAAEVFVVTERAPNVAREAINPDQFVKVEVRRRQVSVPAGATYIPTAQPGGTMAAMALEPDSPGSLIGVGLIPLPADASEAPIYRLAAPIQARLAPVEPVDAAFCAQ